MIEYYRIAAVMAENLIQVHGIKKRFGTHLIFKDINMELRPGDSRCIWGPNGSGKSTLLKIVAGLLRPTSGSVEYCVDGACGRPAVFRNSIGFVAPDVVLYGELTLRENLDFLSQCRGITRNVDYENELVERLFPEGLRDDLVGAFSSGMKRKAQFIAGLCHKPAVIFLDEPTSHLDEAGRAEVANIINTLKNDKILLIASNDPDERSWCGETLELHI